VDPGLRRELSLASLTLDPAPQARKTLGTKVMKPAKEQLDFLVQRTVQVLPKGELLKKLELKKPLKIKLGMDPTAPDLHLGHTVVLSKMRQFQDLGHEIIFLIGDFTTKIGDPTGRSKTRPPLSDEQIRENAKTYFKQVSKVLDQEKTTIVYNSEWLSKLTFSDVVKLCGQLTLARIIEREDFKKRIDSGISVGFHELLYPIMQGYDSVALEADVELGGTDQTFNLLMGRDLQEAHGQKPQVVMTLPLLEGLDGTEKMSKSLGNYVGLSESAEVAYGKLMSISDKLMWRYFELLLEKTKNDVKSMQSEVETEKLHPMNLKKEMAFKIVEKFWSTEKAKSGQKQFESLFQNKDLSQAPVAKVSDKVESPCWIVDLLKAANSISSSSDAKRLIEAGSITLDEKTISEFKESVNWKTGSTLQVGKKKIYRLE
jgi:tyrosyl-tRNA synthetase